MVKAWDFLCTESFYFLKCLNYWHKLLMPLVPLVLFHCFQPMWIKSEIEASLFGVEWKHGRSMFAQRTPRDASVALPGLPCLCYSDSGLFLCIRRVWSLLHVFSWSEQTPVIILNIMTVSSLRWGTNTCFAFLNSFFLFMSHQVVSSLVPVHSKLLWQTRW